MKRVSSIIMVVLFLATVTTGIIESHVESGDAEAHTAVASLFIVSIIIHVITNRKAFVRQLLGKNKK